MKQVIVVFLGLWFSLGTYAQGNRMNIEKRYRAQKIVFITDRMQLTPEEAQAFWPLYNQLETEQDTLSRQMHRYRAAFPKDETQMTEEQAIAYLNFFNKHIADMSKLNLEYQKKFLKVISAKKFVLLHDAENEFRRHLLQEFRGRGAKHGPN